MTDRIGKKPRGAKARWEGAKTLVGMPQLV